MAPRKTAGSGRKTWTKEMKTALHMLWTDHDVSDGVRLQAFKLMFAEVQQWDISDERLADLIKRQICEKKQQRHAIWIEICNPATTAAEVSNRASSRNAIRAALSSVQDPQPMTLTVAAPKVPSKAMPSSTRPGTPRAKSRATAPSQKRSLHATIYAMRETAASTADGGPTALSRPTPLSKRPPVALWTGLDVDGSGDDTTPSPSPKRPRIGPQRPTSVPRQSQLKRSQCPPSTSQTPRTPKRKQTLRSTTLPFVQVHGKSINLTPEKIAKANTDLTPIGEEEAHPPLAGLLFRYWPKSINSGLHNNENGMVARKFHNRVSINQTPPHCTSLDWTDLFYHIDRIGIKTGFQSPFISTSNSLIWIIRLALKELEENPRVQGMISLIDTGALRERSVFHVLPYHRQLRRTFQFTEGSWKYAGTHEFLIWKEVPRRAMIHTFRVQDLLELVRQDDLLSHALRLEVVGLNHDLKSRIIPDLARRQIALSTELVDKLAKLATFGGLGAGAMIEHLSHFVSDLIQGWGFVVRHQSPAQWSQLASVFAESLLRRSASLRNLRDEVKIKRAFLDGVSWGSSSHFNARHTIKTMNLTWKQAKSIGLEDPGKLLHDELAGAQMALMMFEKKQQRMLPGRKTQLLVSSPSDDESFASADESDAEHDDRTIKLGRPPRASDLLIGSENEAQGVAWEDEDDEDQILFEMDDEGRVV